MYAIATVIYGVPISPPAEGERKDVISAELADLFEGSGQPGVISMYSGGADEQPWAFGVVLDTFNECAHDISLDELTLVPSTDQVREFTDLLSALSPELQQEINQYCPVRTFILWSTS